MSEIMPETFVDIMIIFVAITVVFGILVSNLDFRAKVEEHVRDRAAVMLGESLTGSPCLSTDKGVLLSRRLDNPVCRVTFPEDYYFRVEVIPVSWLPTGYRTEWEFGNSSLEGAEKKFPVAVKYPDGTTVPAFLVVKVE
ncbi:MAG: hypothetical protein GXO63_03450 [Candidatus Micrarchaeota archaeon]|nr:hypothetical protein [Candidatus Micrarchaeota archaeon]